jgi:ABC-type long-subunit fatty acid transport system fused permease/ATPase subunit
MTHPSRFAAAAATARRIWALTTPYFGSEEKWRARGLLAAIIALNLGSVYLLVLLNDWNRTFYDALQEKNQAVFWTQLGRFTYLAFALIVVAVYRFWLTQLLEMRWRAWMTRHYLGRWLKGNAFYRMELARFSGEAAAPDNPDQRIQEDLNLFTSATISLSMGLLNAVVTLVSFVGILWTLSGTFSFELGGTTYAIPGFMVWAAIAYCLVGSLITHRIGRVQIPLNFRQQRLEADFRHHMVRVREYSEAIALDRGQGVERGHLDVRFSHVLANWLQLLKAQKNLTWFTSFFGQAAVVFPFLVAAPRFFSGAIQLGELMQISSAFGQVQDSLAWLIDNYSSLASWRATADRLTSFEQNVTAQEGLAAGADMTRRGRAVDAGPRPRAAQRGGPPGRPGTARQGRRPRAGERALGQRQVDAVPRHRRHLAVRARPRHGAGRHHGHPATAVLPRRTPARCARVPGARHALRRRGAAPGVGRRPAAAAEGAAGRRGRLGPEAVGRRAPAARAGPRVPEEPALGAGRRSDGRARWRGRAGALPAAGGAHRPTQWRLDLDRAPAGAGGLSRPPLGTGAGRRDRCALVAARILIRPAGGDHGPRAARSTPSTRR